MAHGLGLSTERPADHNHDMSCSLNCLKGIIIGAFLYGVYYRGYKGGYQTAIETPPFHHGGIILGIW